MNHKFSVLSVLSVCPFVSVIVKVMVIALRS